MKSKVEQHEDPAGQAAASFNYVLKNKKVSVAYSIFLNVNELCYNR